MTMNLRTNNNNEIFNYDNDFGIWQQLSVMDSRSIEHGEMKTKTREKSGQIKEKYSSKK